MFFKKKDKERNPSESSNSQIHEQEQQIKNTPTSSNPIYQTSKDNISSIPFSDTNKNNQYSKTEVTNNDLDKNSINIIKFYRIKFYTY